MSITLYVIPGDGDRLVSLSPFCIKTAVWMKLAGVPHEVAAGNPQQAPNGKLPYIRHEGGLLGDSGLIEQWCREHHDVTLDAHLDARQRSLGLVIRRTIEEHLYWAMLHARWIDVEGFTTLQPLLRPALPALLRPVLPGVLRRGIRKALHAQGLGRHDPTMIYGEGAKDIDAIAGLLAEEGPFLFGAEPSSFDVIIYAFLSLIRNAFPSGRMTDAITAQPRLVALLDAVDARYRA